MAEKNGGQYNVIKEEFYVVNPLGDFRKRDHWYVVGNFCFSPWEISLWQFPVVQQTLMVSDAVLAVRESDINKRASLSWLCDSLSGRDRHRSRYLHYSVGTTLKWWRGRFLKYLGYKLVGIHD